MCQLLEEYVQERNQMFMAKTAEAEARAETAEAETAELKARTTQIAFQLVKKGFSEEESSAITGVPVEEIRKALQA
ncbi:MAG: hypothetical protein II828_03705 [Clostridia bacterium]|nr:hypothetical protein [Clostridia bacterium]